METERVVVITTDNQIHQREIEVVDGFLLQALQDAVGGFFEIVQPMYLEYPYVIVCDDEGILKHKKLNTIASHFYGSGMVGDVVIMKEGFRDGEPDIVGLDDDETQYIMDRIMEVLSCVH